MGFLSFFTCCISLESCDVVIRCKNSRSMTIFGAPIYMACSSFNFWTLRTSLRMCKTSTILRLMASFVVSNGWQACTAILVHILLFLSLLGNSSHLFPIWKATSLQLLQLLPLLHSYYCFPSWKKGAWASNEGTHYAQGLFSITWMKHLSKVEATNMFNTFKNLDKGRGVWNH